MKKALLTSCVVLLVSTLFASDFYWIGGSGEWDDVGHWATASGGTTIHFGIPSANDDVYFDANSFGAPTDEVDLLRLAVQCRSLTVSTSLAVTFVGSGTFTISGNLDLAPGINWDYRGRIELRPEFSPTTLNARDHALGSSVSLVGSTNGSWQVLSNLRGSSSIRVFPSEISFNTGVEIVANSVDFESDGRTDFSDLTFRASRDVSIEAVPSEASTLASCNVHIYGSYPELRLAGIQTFPLGTVSLRSDNNNSTTIQPGHGASGTDAFKADSLSINSNGNYKLDMVLGHFEVLKGTKHFFHSGNRIEVTSMEAIGECLTPIFFEGRRGAEFVANASASINLEQVHVDDIVASGGSSWTATESSGTGNVSGWNFSSAFGEDRYWVGDSGSWDDVAHWSYTSGGPGGACVPKAGNNVFFDAASFSSTTPQVDIPEGVWTVKSLDCSGVTSDFTIMGLSSGDFSIYGSLTLSPRVTWTASSLPYRISFKGPDPGRTLLTHGRTEQLDMHFIGTGGDWTLQDSLSVAVNIYVIGGTLKTNNNPVACRNFQQYTTLTTFIDLGTSLIHIRPIDPRFRGNTGIRFADCNSKEANIFVEDEVTQTRIEFSRNGSAGRNEIDRILSLAPIQLTASDTFDANFVELQKTSIIHVTGYADSLLLSAGAAYSFGASSRTVGLTVDHIKATGTCLEPIIFTGTSNYYLSSPNPQITEFLQIQNLDAIGGPWTANESVDLGSNTGWIFATPPTGRTLYWSGGTGTWFDPAHWSESNTGPTGACPPTRLDNVVFGTGSVSMGDTVYLSQTTTFNSSSGLIPECKTFDARGATGVGVHFAGRLFYVYGSLYAPEGADFVLRDLFLRDTIATAEILLEGSAPGEIELQAKGTYTAIAPINAPRLEFEIRQGTFRTNGLPMELYEISISGTPSAPGILDLDNSTVRLYNGLFAFSMSGGYSYVVSNDAWIHFDKNSVYIRCTENTGGVNMDFPSGGNARLIVNSSSTQADFTTIKFGGSSSISGHMAIDSLILSKGLPYTISNTATQDLTIRKYLFAVGSACSPIPMSAPSGATTNSTFQFDNGAVSAMDYVRIDRIDAHGPGQALAGRNSVNVANVSNGWLYQTVPSVRSLDRYFLGPDVFTCDNTPGLISANVPPAFVATYEWQDGSMNPDFQPNGTGAYYLDIVFEEGTCQLRDSIIISGPEYDLNADEQINGCGSTEVIVDLPNPTASGYRWITESGTINSTNPTSVNVAVPGIYFLEQTIGSCTDSTRYEVDAGSTITKDSLLQFCGTTTVTTSLTSYLITQDTSFSETFLLPNGCDSVLQFTVDILSSSFSDSLISGCAPLNFTSQSGINYTISQDSIIEELFTSFRGCDSIRRYEIQILGQPVSTSFSQTFCSADTLFTPTNTYSVSHDTTIIEQLSSISGCDSTVTWTVFVTRDTVLGGSIESWCEAGTLTTPFATYQISSDSTISEAYSSALGCDSIHTYTINIEPTIHTIQELNWCSPNTFTTNQSNYSITSDTSFTEVYTSFLGCDSLLEYRFVISDTIRTDTTISLCEPTLLATAQTSFTATADTTFYETYTSFTGCDSIQAYLIEFALIQSSESYLTWCSPGSLTTNTDTYHITQDSSFSETYNSHLGCDSTHTYFITVIQQIATDTMILGCDSILLTTPMRNYSLSQDTSFSETYASAQGCDSVRVYQIQLSTSEPIASLVDAQENSCFRQNDGQINLWDPVDNSNLYWTIDSNPLGNRRNITGLAADEYSISVSYGNGCGGDTLIYITEPPAIMIDLPDSIQAISGQAISIFEEPYGGAEPYLFKWSALPDVLHSACPLCPALDFEAIGTGWITLEVQDASGCTLTDSIWLEVPKPEDFYLPNAFSPNNDGVNDILQIYGSPEITVEDLKIFDRWGNMIYTGLDNPKPLIANLWNGQDYRIGVYMIMFTVTWSDGRQELFTQEVHLTE